MKVIITTFLLFFGISTFSLSNDQIKYIQPRKIKLSTYTFKRFTKLNLQNFNLYSNGVVKLSCPTKCLGIHIITGGIPAQHEGTFNKYKRIDF